MLVYEGTFGVCLSRLATKILLTSEHEDARANLISTSIAW